MKRNWLTGWNDGLNPRRFAIFRSVCDRQRFVHFLPRGGFHRRLLIGLGSRESREARMKVLTGSRRARDFFSRRTHKKDARFLRNATLCGFWRTIPTAWRKIPPPF